MNELNNNQEIQNTAEEQSSFNFQTIYTAFILNWKWFLLSMLICIGLGFLYVKYATPIYNITAKLLIKDGDSDKKGAAGGALQALGNMANLGFISDSYGVENELEIITSRTIAEQAIIDLKLYAEYYKRSGIKKKLVYKEQPINVEMDYGHLSKLNKPIELKIARKNNQYKITGTYFVSKDEVTSEGPFDIEKTVSEIPAVIRTQAGNLTLTKNRNFELEDDEELIVYLNSPSNTAHQYLENITVEQTSKTSSVFGIQLKEANIKRATDYINQLVNRYNTQANEDKNEIK